VPPEACWQQAAPPLAACRWAELRGKPGGLLIVIADRGGEGSEGDSEDEHEYRKEVGHADIEGKRAVTALRAYSEEVTEDDGGRGAGNSRDAAHKAIPESEALGHRCIDEADHRWEDKRAGRAAERIKR